MNKITSGTAIVIALWLLGLPGAAAKGPDNMTDAARKALAAPLAQQRDMVRTLLKEPDSQSYKAALAVLTLTFDVALIPELERASTTGKFPRIHAQMKQLLKELRAYQPIAVEGLISPAAAALLKSADLQQDGRKLFRSVKVRVRLLDNRGSPIADASVQAFAEQYGVCVPFQRFQAVNRTGECQLDLFPGKWSFFGAAGKQGSGVYVCKPGVVIEDETTVDLQPDKRVNLQFLDGSIDTGAVNGRRSPQIPAETAGIRGSRGRPTTIGNAGLNKAVAPDEIKVIDSGFGGFLVPVSLGASGPDGTFALWVAAGRPFDVVGCRKAENGVAYLFQAARQTADTQSQVSLGGSNLATLDFQASPGPASAKRVELSLRASCLDSPEMTLSAELPLKVRVSPGQIEAKYTYATGDGYDLVFAPRGYLLAAGQQETVRLGGPYECSVYHEFHKQFGPSFRNTLTYHLFVSDPNKNYLTQCRKSAAKREAVVVPLEVRLGEKQIYTSDKGAMYANAGEIPPGTNLDRLQYRVRLPFDAGAESVIRGHGMDFEKRREHFVFRGPHELAAYADPWLDGADLVYAGFARLLGKETRARSSSRPQEIRFLTLMPPGFGAYAAGGNTNYPVPTVFVVSRPMGIVRTPLRHEILHTFGVGHQDFMDVLCREVLPAMYPDCAGARLLPKDGLHDPLLAFLRGEQSQAPDRVAPAVLAARFGPAPFLGYMEKGRPIRDKLRLTGLSEQAADCAIFDTLTDGAARELFRACGIELDDESLDRAVSVVEGKAALPDDAEPAGQSVGKFLRAARAASDKGDKPAVDRQLTQLVQGLPQVGNYRMRADLYLMAGDLWLRNGNSERAYEMLKQCQLAATHAGDQFAIRARDMCLKLLKGKPIRTLQ